MDLDPQFVCTNAAQKNSHGWLFIRIMRRFALCIALFCAWSSPVAALGLSDYLNEATVTSAEADSNTSTNTSDVQVTPKELTITKTANASGLSSPPVAGETITYVILVAVSYTHLTLPTICSV